MTTPLDTAANLTGSSITEAQAKTWFTAMRDALAQMGDPLAAYGVIQNISLSIAVGAGALTIGIGTRASATHDADSPAAIPFRNVASATGDFSVLNVTAANTFVVSSGSTLGASNGVPFRLWVVMFNDAGTLRLGVVNCRSGTAIMPLSDDALYSSTAEGGAGAADSAQIIYTGTAVSSKALRILGYLDWASGLTAAGTWDVGPNKIQLMGSGVPLPGQMVQLVRTDTGAVASGTTTVPFDDTIPQNTEGDQYMTQAITPRSAANLLSVRAEAQVSHSVASVVMVLSLFQDTTANALKTSASPSSSTADQQVRVAVEHAMLAATGSTTTFKVRMGSAQAGTTTFNGQSGGRKYGGVLNSYMQVAEFMA